MYITEFRRGGCLKFVFVVLLFGSSRVGGRVIFKGLDAERAERLLNVEYVERLLGLLYVRHGTVLF